MRRGVFISFEGTEGSGKSTQITRLADRFRNMGRTVQLLREPGGTSIGEEIRHTLQHSEENRAMTPETELLLLNASRAQLVREIIRPALGRGEIVLCDRFYDSTVVYQGYGRGLDLTAVKAVVDYAVGQTRPDLTILLYVPLRVSESRRHSRQASSGACRDRMEEAGRDFFERVDLGYRTLAAEEPERIKWIDATQSVEAVDSAIGAIVESWLRSS